MTSDAQLVDLGRQASAGITTVERLIEQINKYPHITVNDTEFFQCLVDARYFLMTGRLLKGDESDETNNRRTEEDDEVRSNRGH